MLFNNKRREETIVCKCVKVNKKVPGFYINFLQTNIRGFKLGELLGLQESLVIRMSKWLYRQTDNKSIAVVVQWVGSQLQSPGFDPDLMLLPVAYSFTCSCGLLSGSILKHAGRWIGFIKLSHGFEFVCERVGEWSSVIERHHTLLPRIQSTRTGLRSITRLRQCYCC